MKTYKKFLIALMLFTGFSVYSFGESLIDFNLIGYQRLEESFRGEAYYRSTNLWPLAVNFKHYPNEKSWGFASGILLETFFSGQEYRGDNEMDSLSMSATSLSLLLAPSYRFKLSEKIRIPITFGPVFSLYFERDSLLFSSKNYYYEAFDIGLLLDASINFSPLDNGIFYLKFGVSVEWDFIRFERGKMETDLRETLTARSHAIPYMSAGVSLYFGLGFVIP